MFNAILRDVVSRYPEYVGLEAAVEKEILHHDLMHVLKEEGILGQLAFIGGTSLRMCYGSNRLSEDLDFTAGVNFDPKSFEGLDAFLKEYLESKYGLPVSVGAPNELRGDTASWRVTITKDSYRKDLPSQRLHIDVCAYDSLSVLHRPLADHYGISSPVAGVLVPVQSLNEIMADKLLAFAYRERRIKPRDVWDIVWLEQQRATASAEHISQKLSMRGKDITEFLDLIHQHSDKVLTDPQTKIDFHSEMSRFLPAAVAQTTVSRPEFWDYIGVTVDSVVSRASSKITDRSPGGCFKM